MALVHYLFLGHFEHDGNKVLFSKQPGDSEYRPVVRHPLDIEAVRAALREVQGPGVEDLAFPDDWTVWLDRGYLVCEKYTRNQRVIDFVARLVRRTGCDIHDVGAHRDITLCDWLAATDSYATP